MRALRWFGVQPGPRWALTTTVSRTHDATHGSTVGTVWSRPGWLHVSNYSNAATEGTTMTLISNLRRRIVFVETDRVGGWPSIRLVIYTRAKNPATGAGPPSPQKPAPASG